MRDKTIASALVLLVVLFSIPPGFSGEARKRISDLRRTHSHESSVDIELRFGRELAARILGNYPLLDDDAANRYVNLVGRAIALYAGGPVREYHFGILNAEEINAFAAPGGYVFITRGAVASMENEAQLAAVLGHEIAHVMKRHVIKEIDIRDDKGSAVSGIAALIGGATGGFRGAFDKALSDAEDILLRKGYMIEDEIEADRTGIIIAAMAGYDPQALRNFLVNVGSFEKVRQTSDGEHPAMQTRLDMMAVTLEENSLLNMHGRKVRERYYDHIQKIRY